MDTRAMRNQVRRLFDHDMALTASIRAVEPDLDLEPLGDLLLPFRAPDRAIRFVGFDEAGRGALAGPVTVACVSVDLGDGEGARNPVRKRLAVALAGLDDSKLVPADLRTSLREAIVHDFDWGVGHASPAEIDRVGVVAACRLAARRACKRLLKKTDFALLDRGLSLDEAALGFRLPQLQLTHGDTRSLHIAAASVLAKVARDAVMVKLDARVPGYGLAAHKGYATGRHCDALRQLGPSRIHRRSFCRRIETPESQSC